MDVVLITVVVSEHLAVVTESSVGLVIAPMARAPTEHSVVSKDKSGDVEATDGVPTTSNERKNGLN